MSGLNIYVQNGLDLFASIEHFSFNLNTCTNITQTRYKTITIFLQFSSLVGRFIYYECQKLGLDIEFMMADLTQNCLHVS